nr:MAG TPA: hypothetical protein [Caudoviricetes sp.]
MGDLVGLAGVTVIFVCVMTVSIFCVYAMALFAKWIKLEIENLKEGNSFVNPKRTRSPRKSNTNIPQGQPGQHFDSHSLDWSMFDDLSDRVRNRESYARARSSSS